MSATARRIPLEQADEVARDFAALIEDACVRLTVAGSVRRRVRTVGDIEVVVVPRLETVPQKNLFGEEVFSLDVDHLGDRLAQLVETGVIARRRRSDGRSVWGPSSKMLTYRDVPIDLFSPEPERFGWILTIRTGPRAFSNALVTPTHAHTASGRPGLMPSRYASEGGWIVERMTKQRVPTPNERDVFELLDLIYLEPWERT